MLTLINNVLDSVWNPFVALLTRYGDNLSTLFRLGFSDGGFLAGRVLNLSSEAASYSDETVEALVRIGDELGEAGLGLSDEAVGGMGRLANTLPEENLQRLIHNLCPGGVAYRGNYRGPGLASPLPAQTCSINFQQIFENVFQWDEEALDGFKKLHVNDAIDDAILSEFLTKYADDAVTSNTLLKVVGESSVTWRKNSFKGLDRAADEFGSGVIDAITNPSTGYADDVVEKTFGIFGASTVTWKNEERLTRLGKVLNRHNVNSAVTQGIDNLKDVDGIDKLVFDLGSTASNIEKGALFQLEYSAFLGSGKISKVADEINGQGAADIILKDGTLIDTKLRDWSKLDEYTFGFDLQKDIEQARRFAEDIPEYENYKRLIFVFDSQFGTVPGAFKAELESISFSLGIVVNVKSYP